MRHASRDSFKKIYFFHTQLLTISPGNAAIGAVCLVGDITIVTRSLEPGRSRVGTIFYPTLATGMPKEHMKILNYFTQNIALITYLCDNYIWIINIIICHQQKRFEIKKHFTGVLVLEQKEKAIG